MTTNNRSLAYVAKVSLGCVSAALLSSCLIVLPISGITFLCWILCSYFVFLLVVNRLLFKGEVYHAACCSTFLGISFVTGLAISVLTTRPWNIFGWYTCIIAFFHYSEYITIAYSNPKTLSVDSFLLNHSYMYGCAAAASWIEFIVEAWFFPDLNSLYYVSWLGLLLCIGGEALRKSAMLTARTNFDHLVRYKHEKGHKLVTHGVYQYFRHPSYVGWFYWSIGTQMVLVNPVCTIGYAVASWLFFRSRIQIEEVTLLSFFGGDYHAYQQRTGTGLPFISGYKLEE